MTLKDNGRLRAIELKGGMTVLVPPVPGVVFTTRLGGGSGAPYDSLNLSVSVGDAPEAVTANRRRVSHALGIPSEWITARQVHGCAVLAADALGAGAAPVADAVVVQEVGRPVAVLVADCVPIALTGAGVAGAVHAGWRGLCRGVIAAGVGAARDRVPASEAISAWIGPCIGPCCFEVGVEVPAAFAAGHPGAPDFSLVVDGSLRFDLPRAAAFALRAAGATVAEPVDVPCTSCDPRLFSYRRDGGTTGRQALVTWRVPTEAR